MSQDNPDYRTIITRVEGLKHKLESFKGLGFRCAAMAYSGKEDIISGEGGKKYGNRWNPVGIRTVYASLAAQTAISEIFGQYGDHHAPQNPQNPMVIVSVLIDISRILDLSDEKNCRTIGFSKDYLINEDWMKLGNNGRFRSKRPSSASTESKTQQVGKAVKESGYSGLIAPSAKDPKGKNIVIFPDNLDPNRDTLKIFKEEHLPK